MESDELAKNPEVLRALKEYARAATIVLAECEPVLILGLAKWVPSGEEGQFALVQEEQFEAWPCVFQHREELQALPENKRLAGLLRDDPVIGPQMDMLVGGGGLTRIDLNDSLDQLLGSMFAALRAFALDEPALEAAYLRFEEGMHANDYAAETFSPIPGIAEELLPLALQGVEIDLLTDEEIGRALMTGAIDHGPLLVPSTIVNSRSGARVRYRIPKIVWDGVGDPPRRDSDPTQGAAELLEDLAIAIRLVKGGRWPLSGVIHIAGSSTTDNR
ncbi:MAG: hypothetical protein ACRDH7_01000 [Actinomycetota bacterium]